MIAPKTKIVGAPQKSYGPAENTAELKNKSKRWLGRTNTSRIGFILVAYLHTDPHLPEGTCVLSQTASEGVY